MFQEPQLIKTTPDSELSKSNFQFCRLFRILRFFSKFLSPLFDCFPRVPANFDESYAIIEYDFLKTPDIKLSPIFNFVKYLKFWDFVWNFLSKLFNHFSKVATVFHMNTAAFSFTSWSKSSDVKLNSVSNFIKFSKFWENVKWLTSLFFKVDCTILHKLPSVFV